MIPNFLYGPDYPFPAFGLEHLLLALGFVVFSVVTMYLAKNHWSTSTRDRFFELNGWAVCLAVVAYTILKLYTGTFNIKEDLPLYLCNVIGLLIPFFTLTRSHRLFEVLYFWTLGGTLQALITPDLSQTFPHYIYLKYWLVHMGLVYIILYATIVYKMRPVIKSIWRSILWLEVYFVLTVLINYLLGANYCYLNEQPPVGTLLDYFGPWPIYILVTQLLLVPIFFILYLPYLIKDLWHRYARLVPQPQHVPESD